MLAFQWDRDAPPPQRRYPHLHVGSVMTSGSPYAPGTPLSADRFNKLHVPTGRLSLGAVLLFAVDELGALPAAGRSVGDVRAVLEEGDRRFRGEAG